MKFPKGPRFLSHLIRDLRLSLVARQIRSNSIVLDLACGEGLLNRYLPPGCKYRGIDRRPSSRATEGIDRMTLDLMREDAVSRVQERWPVRPDYITSIAFLEHIANPGAFLLKCSTLLGGEGFLVGATPHPRGRRVHDALSRIHLLSRHAADEHQSFLGRTDLARIATLSGGTLVLYQQFLLGFNQLFVIEYRRRS